MTTLQKLRVVIQKKTRELIHELTSYQSLENSDNYKNILKRVRALEKKFDASGVNVYEVFLNIRDPQTDLNELLWEHDGYIKRDIIFNNSQAVNDPGKNFKTDFFIVGKEPNQIKSATDNSGEFNADNPSILFQTVDLTQEFNDIDNGTLTEKDIENHLISLIGQVYDTVTKPLKIKIEGKNKKHILNSNIKLEKGKKKRHLATIEKIEQVINNAVKTTTEDVDLTHNTNKKTLAYKKTLSKIVNFESPIQIKNNLYTVVIVTARVNGQAPNVLDLYNIRVKNNGSIGAHLSTSPQSQPKNNIPNVILSTILFQTEGELLEEARSFDSWQEWKEYVETFADSFDYDQVPKFADDTWYRTTWELANREPQQEGNTDENFIDYMSNRENLKDFLAEIANIDSTELWQPSDEAEAREIEDLQNKKDIIDTKLAQWKGFARGILYGNELKESTYKNLGLTTLQKLRVVILRKLNKPEEDALDDTHASWNKILNKVSPYDGVPYNEDKCTYMDTRILPEGISEENKDQASYIYLPVVEYDGQNKFEECSVFYNQIMNCITILE